jgi:hypothetical protein
MLTKLLVKVFLKVPEGLIYRYGGSRKQTVFHKKGHRSRYQAQAELISSITGEGHMKTDKALTAHICKTILLLLGDQNLTIWKEGLTISSSKLTASQFRTWIKLYEIVTCSKRTSTIFLKVDLVNNAKRGQNRTP